MKVAHIDAFRRDPKAFWEYYRPRFHSLADKEPNPAHAALAELEARGLLDAVITQNIDRLHRAAGSRRVVEVHGSIATSSCTSCEASYPLADVPALFGEDGVAECSLCCGLVKPDVVLFGEYLPEAAIAEAQRAGAGGGPAALHRDLARGAPGRRAGGHHARGGGSGRDSHPERHAV